MSEFQSGHKPQQSGRRVNVLPPELANQIAAGEVIERPASAIKELVENALDAGATEVFVTISEGGRELIRVSDNGHGMSSGDAQRALERHATSKIVAVEDLFTIGTLGFRGEALPSIASVSRFTIETQEPGALEGTRIEVEGGKVLSVGAAGLPHGTTIEVRDLFFNTPARLKFLKTTPTEVRHISETLVRVALAHPGVHIRLTHNGRKVLDFPPCKADIDRVQAVFGKDLRDALFPTFDYGAIDGITCRGFWSRPDVTQRSTSNFYVFVNGRYVRDKTIHAAINGSYRGMLEKRRYPSVVLYLDVPHHLVDVNVHPTKIEVRFSKSDSIYRAVYHAIHDALQQTPWVEDTERTYTLKTVPKMGEFLEPLNVRHAQAALPIGEHRGPTEPMRVPIRDVFDGTNQSPSKVFREPGTHGVAPIVADPFGVDADDPFAQPQPASALHALRADPEPEVVHVGAEQNRGEKFFGDKVEGDGYFSRLKFIGQFRSTYLVCEDASGLVIIDQHASHERIGYERLRAMYKGRMRESQQLLVAKRLSLDAVKAATLNEHLEFFARIGFEIENFGGSDFVIKAAPAILKPKRYERIIKDALDDLGQLGRSSRMDEALEAVFARMACHAVIRAGDHVGPQEALALFRQMDEIDFGANCPHGRPVYFRLPLVELEEAFGRTE